MKFLYQVLRIKEWLGSKLVMQIGIFLMLAFCCGLGPVSVLKPFALFVSYAITYFALGYIANDLSDIKSDRKVGKRNAFRDAGVGLGIVIFIVLSVLNLGIALIVSRNWVCILIVSFGYLLGIFYSFKPLRFKERGSLGLIVASLCQRNLQLAIIPFLFSVNIVLYAVMNALSFINGVRYILIHQYMDHDNDVRSGTATFAVKRHELTRAIIVTCFCVELVLAVGCFVYAVGFRSYWLSAIAAGLLCVECSLYFMIAKSKQSVFTSYTYVPLDFFYLFGFPITFLALIGAGSPLRDAWGCLIIALFLVWPTYSLLRTYLGYLKFFVRNRKFIHGCRRLWKITETVGGLYFIHVKPVFEAGEEDCRDLQSYAIMSVGEVSVPFSKLRPYLQGGVSRELIYDADTGEFERPMRALQLKNKSMLHYFAIYIIPKEVFWMNRRKSAAETIVNCMAHSGTQRETVSIEGAVCRTARPDREFYKFAGMACAELYSGRKDCFMTVFPSFLIFLLFWAAAGTVGIFLYPMLALFSGGTIALFCLATLIDKAVSVNAGGIGPIHAFTFYRCLHRYKFNGKRVPVYKKYGIYTGQIVRSANRLRNQLTYAVCAMVISLIVVCTLMSLGVAI